ncbi:hypothetical protein [Asaia siamensis]|uniref:Uncharacterized protein n=1 Tax=Asaia siamensis TaxID=110479 RepID=A0ABQ1MKH4_9PROT|nr:hypothetical protein [Asaia siamensis]GBR07116.1 hypothetical protein AA0323_1677 [Asaia siamensis NRIC 0323]GGC42013.1 hypothetical protein GCM10007207_29170 [Asaia siamensis]
MSHDPTEFFLRLQESVEQSRQNTERAALRLRERLNAMERMTDQCSRLLGQMEYALETTLSRLSHEPPTPEKLTRRPWQKIAWITVPLLAAALVLGWKIA